VELAAGDGGPGLCVGGVFSHDFAGDGFGLVPAAESQVGAEELVPQALRLGHFGADLLENGEGRRVVAAELGDIGADEVDRGGVTEIFEHGLDGALGLVGKAELDLAMRQALGKVRAERHGLVGLLKQRQGLHEAAAVEEGGGELPRVFAVGLLDRCGIILRKFLDVAEGGEVLEEFRTFLLAEGHGIHGGGIAAFPGLEFG
jgi:hypothetical protein